MNIPSRLFPQNRLNKVLAILIVLITGQALSGSPVSFAQVPIGFERERGRSMLRTIKEDLKKNYYDPNYHGMDIESRFKTADAKIKEATSIGQIFGVIAEVLIELNDSHTFFLPPGRASQTEYGWQIQAVGDKCYVVAVKPGSDAEAKGLKPGDEVLAVDGVDLSRQNVWVFRYLYQTLRPRPGVRLIIKKGGQEQQIDVLAKVREGKRVLNLEGPDIWDVVRQAETEGRLHRHRNVEMGDDLFIWKMPEFDIPADKVDSMVDKFRKRKAVIIDLRGNPGGLEEMLTRLVSNIIDHDVKIGDLKGRKETKPLIAKSRGDDVFKGKLAVLIDSNSGSAAELFARIMQLEKRGLVIGDRSAGAVMRARNYPHDLGMDVIVSYGVSITESDVIMSDGKSLEHVGVVPDKLMLPEVNDLALGNDPVLAYAASEMGVKLSAAQAGKLFPIEWRK